VNMSPFTQRKSMRVSSYLGDRVVLTRTVLPLELLGSRGTSLTRSVGLKRVGGPLGVGHLRGTHIQVSSECLGLDDHRGVFAALDIALVGMLESRVNSDDSVGPWHIELKVGVVRDAYDLRIAWPPQHGMVSATKSYYLKSGVLLPEVGGIPKSDGQDDLPMGYGLLPRHDAMEGCSARAELGPIDSHGLMVST
jgi:hypothetical protein